jgi:hypothetical protein
VGVQVLPRRDDQVVLEICVPHRSGFEDANDGDRPLALKERSKYVVPSVRQRNSPPPVRARRRNGRISVSGE